MSKPRVLIVEDDREMRQSLLDLLEAAGWEANALPRAAEVARKLEQFDPEVILSDLRMPGMSGLELLQSLQDTSAPPVVLISAHGDIPMAVEAMQSGAYSFVEKPYEPRRLLTILSHAADQHRIRHANQRLRDSVLRLSGLDRVLLGQTEAMSDIRDQIVDLADSAAAVLIQGETGTGKNVVARALHDLGARGQGPFVAINAAELTPPHLSDVAMKARNGTLFLDEICACPMDVQAMLLRLIEAKEVLPADQGAPIKIDLRVVCATNEDIDAAVAEGKLRADLLFRVNTFSVHLPALRSRRDDIILLATHFLDEIAQTYEIQPPEMDEADLGALLAHEWPGNVRELRSVVERRILAARRGIGSFSEAISPKEAFEDIPDTLRLAVAAFERELISKALTAHSGRMDAVAEALGIGRRTLNEKIVKLGLDKDALL